MNVVNRAALKKLILKRLGHSKRCDSIKKAYTRVSKEAVDDYCFEIERVLNSIIDKDIEALRLSGKQTFKRAHQ